MSTTTSTIDRWGESIDQDQPHVPRRLPQEQALSDLGNDANVSAVEDGRWSEPLSPLDGVHSVPHHALRDQAVEEAAGAVSASSRENATSVTESNKEGIMTVRGFGSTSPDEASDFDIKPTLPRRQETGSVKSVAQDGEDETMPPAGGSFNKDEISTELSSHEQTTEAGESTPSVARQCVVKKGTSITDPIDTAGFRSPDAPVDSDAIPLMPSQQETVAAASSGSPDTPADSNVTPLPPVLQETVAATGCGSQDDSVDSDIKPSHPKRQETLAATGSDSPDTPVDPNVKPLPPRRQGTLAATCSGSPHSPVDRDVKPLPPRRQETLAATGSGSPQSPVDPDVEPFPPRRQESIAATTRGEGEEQATQPGAFRVGGNDDLDGNIDRSNTLRRNHNTQSDLADIKRQVREEIMGRATTLEASCSKAKAKSELVSAAVHGPQDAFGTVADADVKPALPRRQETASTAPSVAQERAPGAFPSGGDYNIPSQDDGTIVYDIDAGIAATNNHTQSSLASRESMQQMLRLPTLEAVPVQEDAHQQRVELEEELRQQILQEAVQADVVVHLRALHEEDEEEGLAVRNRRVPDDAQPEGNDSSYNLAQSKRTIRPRMLALTIVLLVVGLAIGLSARKSGNDGATETSNDGTKNNTPQSSLLEQIKKRGYFRCGIYLNQPGFGYQDKKTGIISGANYEFCRAISASVFSDDDKFEIVTTNAGTRFGMLANGEIDVISQPVTATMERDMAEQYTGKGFSFSYPFYYTGTMFGGAPEFLQCAERLDPFHGHCRGLRVCVTIGTTQEAVVNELLPGPVAVRYEEPADAIKYMNDGTCNVIAAERHHMHTGRLRTYQGLMFNVTFELGNSTFSRDPLALVTVDGEPEWSHSVNSVIKIMFTAEDLNITKQNALYYQFEDQVPIALQERIRKIVSTVGNYGEIFQVAEEGQQDVVSRTSANSLNKNLDSGLMYSHPFGNLNRPSPEQATNSPTMGHIQAQGYLRCGITNMEPGFAWRNASSDEWSGLHTEVCRGLAAALFQGDPSKVEFIGSDEGFRSLQEGMVDVLAGETATLTNEFFEPSTGNSYSFSTPYFYKRASNSSGQAFIFALATNRKDDLWSSFVDWAITALLYAEERGISASTAIDMPITSLFGFHYAQSFRDCISAIGSYAEIYNGTLGSILPRQGGNLLNKYPYGPQQVAFPLY